MPGRDAVAAAPRSAKSAYCTHSAPSTASGIRYALIVRSAGSNYKKSVKAVAMPRVTPVAGNVVTRNQLFEMKIAHTDI